jgi:hypothetical protein
VKRRHSYLIRHLDDEGYLETFLVSAVAASLLVRLYLYLTGFPQVGGKGLHVAHMLWGGLLMVVGIAMLVNYLDRRAHRIAAMVAGAGFGLFIDELGKFITSDNNYFFRPAASIIYIVFILLYLVIRLLQHERNVTQQEYLINSLETLKEAVIRGYDRTHVERARLYLSRSGVDGPITRELGAVLDSCPSDFPLERSRWQERKDASHEQYGEVVHSRWFPRAVVVFFLVQALFTLLVAVIVTASVTGFALPSDPSSTSGGRHLIQEADVGFAALASALVFLGAVILPRSRLTAYRSFKLAMLISIFLTEIFEFYDIQFGALFGLGFNIVGLLFANALILREKERQRLEIRSDRVADAAMPRADVGAAERGV